MWGDIIRKIKSCSVFVDIVELYAANAIMDSTIKLPGRRDRFRQSDDDRIRKK
jgi:hypothetical protein